MKWLAKNNKQHCFKNNYSLCGMVKISKQLIKDENLPRCKSCIKKLKSKSDLISFLSSFDLFKECMKINDCANTQELTIDMLNKFIDERGLKK